MINKIILAFIIFIVSCNSSMAQIFKFETKNIEIIDEKNEIIAGKGKVISLDDDLEINADKFKYFKDLDILKANGNGLAIIRSKNIKFEFDNAIFDQKNLIIEANQNVNIDFTDKGLNIKTDKIILNQKKNLLKSNSKTLVKDNFKNNFISDSFVYEIDKNLLKTINLISRDKDDNTLKTPIAFINTASGKIFGKDMSLELNNSSFNDENQPRLKGNDIIHDQDKTEITKGVFTTCKKSDGCPPWQLFAKKIKHDKKKQTMFYDGALLKVYDVPVMYFPKFFHPGPKVKRRSGFLVPAIKSSTNSGNFLNTPYFLAIAENKDATFSPRFYAGEKILLQTEYRQVNFKSAHNVDFSLFKEKDKSSKNHFFYKFSKILDFNLFKDSIMDLKIQKTSNDTYLKKDKLKSELIEDKDVLENSFALDLYSNDLSITIDTKIYENLNKVNNDRFEFILPKVNLKKNLENKTALKGNFTLNSQGLIRNYNSNIYEKVNINDLIFESFPSITKNGFYNNYEFLIKNSNSNTQNSENYKDEEDLNVSTLFQFNSSLPLIKDDGDYQKIFKPLMSIKVAPDYTKNNQNSESRIDTDNIYSLQRATNDNSVEGGISIAYGSNYVYFDKIQDREIIDLSFANNIRFNENEDLPKINQIGEKTSNFFSGIKFSPIKNIDTKYNTSFKNNLSDRSYENLITEFKINNLVTTFDYLNENNTAEKKSYLSNKTEYMVDKNNSLLFSTRKNKKSNLTEYYNMMYQYKNDCLAASIEYNKDYYNDNDIKPSESIFFKLTIIPFSETSSPNLKK
tara:strand:+ start:2812 stop:5196 length:2385 start_codon:yes stop_codon:yes gene_type:complete